MDNHRARMEEIQKRKAERRKKQIFKNRCIAIVFCVLLLILIIFGISSCISSVAKNIAEKKEVQITPVPEATGTPVPLDRKGISQDYYKNSAFLGNSFIEGMVTYDLIDGADYFAKVGLNVKTVFTDFTQTGSVPVIEELNSTKVYDKIFLMFGENELGWPAKDIFVDDYTRIINKAKQYQPEATIYLLSVTPISEEASEESTTGETNENVVKMNKLIKELAKEQKVVYCDIYDAVVNEDGVLPDDAATDGIHFGSDYYKKCLQYIQENYDDDTVDGIVSGKGTSSSSSNKSSSSSSSSSKSSSSSSSSNKSNSSSSSTSNKSSSSSNSSSGTSNKSNSSSNSSTSGSGSSTSNSSSSTSSNNTSSNRSNSTSGGSSSSNSGSSASGSGSSSSASSGSTPSGSSSSASSSGASESGGTQAAPAKSLE